MRTYIMGEFVEDSFQDLGKYGIGLGIPHLISFL